MSTTPGSGQYTPLEIARALEREWEILPLGMAAEGYKDFSALPPQVVLKKGDTRLRIEYLSKRNKDNIHFVFQFLPDGRMFGDNMVADCLDDRDLEGAILYIKSTFEALQGTIERFKREYQRTIQARNVADLVRKSLVKASKGTLHSSQQEDSLYSSQQEDSLYNNPTEYGFGVKLQVKPDYKYISGAEDVCDAFINVELRNLSPMQAAQLAELISSFKKPE